MGQRANLVIVKQGGYELYYSHWCANTLLNDLFWGPKHAISFIEAQSKVDETSWLDDVWAEGGVMLDVERKLLLFYGGEDVRYDIPYRRVFIQLMQTIWEGWILRWAYEGILDIASYVGVPREHVTAHQEERLSTACLEPPEEKDWVDTIASLKFKDDEILIFPLWGGIDGYLLNGPQIVDNCNKSLGYPQFRWDEWSSNFPTEGFHLDIVHQTMDIWHAISTANLVQRLHQKWPGWVIREHYDRFEEQVALAEGRLQLHPLDLEKILLDMKASLLSSASNPLDAFSVVVERLQQDGKNVEVSPSAFMHATYELSEHKREDLFHEALDVFLKSNRFQVTNEGLKHSYRSKMKKALRQMVKKFIANFGMDSK